METKKKIIIIIIIIAANILWALTMNPVLL